MVTVTDPVTVYSAGHNGDLLRHFVTPELDLLSGNTNLLARAPGETRLNRAGSHPGFSREVRITGDTPS